MKRRELLALMASLLTAPALGAPDAVSPRFRFCLLRVGRYWNERARALIKLSFEIQKRCNIPIEGKHVEASLAEVARVGSPFFIISGRDAFPEPTPEEAGKLRLVLDGGGLLLFDDNSPEGDRAFYDSAVDFMLRIFPEHGLPAAMPPDHAIYQSYYLLRKPRGRMVKEDYLEGWQRGTRTAAIFSHNDLLGAMEADPLGNWTRNMEVGGSLRRELCFRLGINMIYYTLTLSYKKDRAFPPIIERRRRL